MEPSTLGIWIAIAIGNLLHALLITERFRQGAWMHRTV
jgi:Na+-driven multidrug efflux pump